MLSPKNVGLVIPVPEDTRDTCICSARSFDSADDAKKWAKQNLVWINSETKEAVRKSVWDVGMHDKDGKPGGTTHLKPSARKMVEEIKTVADFRANGDFSRFGGGVRCVPVYTSDDKTSISFMLVYKRSMNPIEDTSNSCV
jgi:hypothetical protein